MIDARIDPLFTMSDNTFPRGSKSNTETKMFLLRTNEVPAGGARRDRTDDLLLAKQALSQLSYGPGRTHACLARRNSGRERTWWAWEDLNFRPHAYQARALTN